MDNAIQLQNVWVQIDGYTILKDITLTLPDKVLLGIIGPNGGGKTTLLKVILGLTEPSQGSVKIFGKSPKEIRSQIGYVPQRGFFDRDFPISVWEAVLMGRLAHRHILSGFRKKDYQIAEESLKEVDLFNLKDRQIGELSEGQRQRVLIARALANEPKLLLLDEPTASVDQKIQTGLYELLGRMKGRVAIVLISHDIGVIASYVDKIACLNLQLYYHDSKEIHKEDLEAAYQCPVDLIGHGVPHRVVHEHRGHKDI